MPRTSLLIFAALAGLLLPAVGAPAPRSSSPRALPRPAAPRVPVAGDTQLGPDDVISVTVMRHPELSADQITITSSGRIYLPEAGTIYVSGKTPNQLAREIERRLSNTLVQPEVTVALRQARSRQVFVQGAVTRPNVYAIRGGWRISEALAAAGGIVGRADEVSVTLARAGSGSATVTASSILDNPAGTSNRRLLPGDVLVLTALEPRRVSVSGDVVKPDVYELRRAPRLLDAINAASGLRQRPDQSRAFLIRGGKRVELDVNQAFEAKTSAANTVLRAGDTIIVEAIAALKVSVDGFVRNPGSYTLEPGSGVVQAVAQAGGLTVPADQVVAGVRRGRELLPVDLTRAVFDPSADVELQVGDVVLASEPQVTRVQVTGQVRAPSALRLPLLQSTLIEAIARAGGTTIQPSQARISVLRQVNGKPFALRINPVDLLEARDLRQNVRLQDGDLVSITQAQVAVAFVSGEVVRPGSYDLKEGDGVPELIARAGGPTPDAALTRVVLQHGRGGDLRTLNLYGEFKGLAPASTGTATTGATGRPAGGTPASGEAALQDGDFVVVPRNLNRVLVIQAVVKPGYYSIPENETLTVVEALSLAGGPRDRAAVKEIAVLRPSPQGTRARVVKLERIRKGDLAENIALQPGDVVYVPEGKGAKSVLGSVGSVIGLLGSAKYIGGF